MDPPFETLESQIEGMWRELLGDELSLYDMPQVCGRPQRCLPGRVTGMHAACMSIEKLFEWQAKTLGPDKICCIRTCRS